MQWNRDEIGKLIQTTRLMKGLTLEDVSEMTGAKADAISNLEKGQQTRPPRKDTLAKLEKALEISIPIVRDSELPVMLYVPADKKNLIEEARTKWPTKSAGAAVMAALQAWSDHRTALRKWNDEHPGANLEV